MGKPMRMTMGLRSFAAFVGMASALFAPMDVRAFGELTHQRLVEAAVEAMVNAESVPAPTGVDPHEWTGYTGRLVASGKRLQNLRSGLNPVYRFSSDSERLLNVPVGTYNSPEGCGYHTSTVAGRDLNLLHAETIRIRE